MKQFSKAQLQRARTADLYDFLLRYHANQFKIEGKSLRPTDNHSISIKRGYSGYYDFSNGEKGNSIDFLIRHMGYTLDEAVYALCGEISQATAKRPAPACDCETVSFPPPLKGKYRHLFAYLMKRGIAQETIQALIDFSILYQEPKHNNMVFINKERDWAEVRGTYTANGIAYHGIVTKSRHDGFWWFASGDNPQVAYICEASIDAISLYELHRLNGNLAPAYYISIGGVTKQDTINRIKNKKKTIIAVDNDYAGQLCRDKNSECESIIPKNKDWNEDLCERVLNSSSDVAK